MVALLFVLFVCLLVAAFIGLVVWLILLAHKRAEKRQQGMAAYAAHREWDFRPSDPALVSRFSGAPFGTGYGQRASNVLLGTHEGRPLVAFDYHYTTSSGGGKTYSSTTHSYSVIALNLGVRTPGLSVGPTTAFGRLWNNLTGRDIEIGDPPFDQHFTVISPAPEFARDVLLSDVREVMQRNPELAWRIDGDSILMLRAGQHTPQEIEAKLHVMDAVLDRIPAHVWDRLRGEQPR